MKNKNQLSQKEARMLLSTDEIAEIVDCSPSLVKQVIAGDRNATKGNGAKIALVVDLAQHSKNLLVEELKRIVKFQ